MYEKIDRISTSNRKLQTRSLKRSNKFGIELTKTVEQALYLNVKNGKTLWTEANN